MATAKATPAKKAPAKAAPRPAHPPVHHTDQVVKSQPVSCEIRINGRIRFANPLIYDPQFEVDDEHVSFSCDLNPTWIERQLPAPTRFVDRTDPRDGDEVIMRVHSGRRDIATDPDLEQQ